MQVPNNTVIDADGTRCNGTLTCVNGVAKNLDVKVVDDGRACTTDSCDPATGVVKHEEQPGCIDCNTVDECPKVDVECQSYKSENKICARQLATGPTCNDGLACTSGDRCVVLAQAQRAFAAAPAANASDTSHSAYWVLVERQSAVGIGILGLVGRAASDAAEVGAMVLPGWHSRGFAAEAIAALADHAFASLSLNRLHTRHAAGNAAAAGLMNKLGFVLTTIAAAGAHACRWELRCEHWPRAGANAQVDACD